MMMQMIMDIKMCMIMDKVFDMTGEHAVNQEKEKSADGC